MFYLFRECVVMWQIKLRVVQQVSECCVISPGLVVRNLLFCLTFDFLIVRSSTVYVAIVIQYEGLFDQELMRREAVKEHETYRKLPGGITINPNSQAIITNQFPYKETTQSCYLKPYTHDSSQLICYYVIWIVMALSCMLLCCLRQLMSS